MYLPNPDLRPTGYEPAEFLDVDRAGEPGDRRPAPTDRGRRPTAHLDARTRLDIIHWAEEYIADLVENHQGDREDVRAVIHGLQAGPT